MSNWTKEDIALVQKFIEIRGKGLYCDGTQVTEAYNRILNKNLRPTSCGQCIRQRINELEASMKRFIAKSEEENAKESGFTTTEEAMEESKKIMEEHKEMEVQNATIEGTPKTKPRGKGGGKK